MAHIPYVPYDEAEGLLAELYERFRDSDGMLDNIIRVPVSYTHLTLPTILLV